MLSRLISMIFGRKKNKLIADTVVTANLRVRGIRTLKKGWKYVVLCDSCNQVTAILAYANPNSKEVDKYNWGERGNVPQLCAFCGNHVLGKWKDTKQNYVCGGRIVSAQPRGWGRWFRWEIRQSEHVTIRGRAE